MTDVHPDAVRLYEELRRRGTAPPRPREYGLRVITELLRILEGK